MKVDIRLIYLYLFSFVGLLITVIGFIRLTELALKVYVFKDADKISYYEPAKVYAPDGKPLPVSTEEAKIDEERIKKSQEEEAIRQRQREIAGSLSMIVIGAPLYLYHWGVIQKENKKKR
jgi:hypothetical protein